MTVVSYRYSNDNIYAQPIINRESDKENIIQARADWRADGVVPTEEFNDVFLRWVDDMDLFWKQLGMTENTKAEAARVGAPKETNDVTDRGTYSTPFYTTHLFYEKSTDDFIGFARGWHNSTDLQQIVTCIHPDKRGNKYMSDFSIIGGKAWFLYAGGETMTHLTPKGRAAYYVENPNIETHKTADDRIDPVDYIQTVITKQQYIAHMNKPENQADRDANFTIERYIEV